MTASLRDVSLVGSENQRIRTPNLIGLDESQTNESHNDVHVVTAVRCSRDDDIDLVRALIENDLRPFQHKSSSILRYGDLSQAERATRVENFIRDLEDTGVTWSAIVCEGFPSDTVEATAAVVAAKKSITNGLSTGDVSYECGKTAILHDGAYNPYDDYYGVIRKLVRGHFDSGFHQNICPIYLAFLQEADQTYPQNTAADYIAGYLCDQLGDGSDPVTAGEKFDQSWIDPAQQEDPYYRLKEFQPIREEKKRSRVVAWITGKGFPQDPTPTTQDPYLDLIDQIEDEVVYNYLRNEL